MHEWQSQATTLPTLRNVTLYLPCRGLLAHASVGVTPGSVITVCVFTSKRGAMGVWGCLLVRHFNRVHV